MITKLFNRDLPFLWFAWPAISILLWFPSLFSPIYSESIVNQSFQGEITYFLNWAIQYKLIAVLITWFSVVFQAFILKHIVSKHELNPTNNFFVPVIYVITLSIFQFDIILNPFLLMLSFILVGFNQLLDLGKESNRKQIAFEIGILTGILSIIYHPLIYLLPIIWIALFLFKSFETKEWIRPLVGISLPFLYYLVYLYWIENLENSVSVFLDNISQFHISAISEISRTAGTARIWLIVSLIICSPLFFNYLNSNIMRKKYSHLLFVWIVFICLTATIFTALTMTSFFICVALILTTFYSVFASIASKKIVSDLILISGLILVVINQLIAFGYL